MNNFEIIKFKKGDKEIDIKVDPTTRTAWFTSADLQTLFERDKATISRHLNAALKSVNQKGSIVAKRATNGLEQEQKLGRKATYYNLEIVTKIAQKINPELREKLTTFLVNYFDQFDQEIVPDEQILIYDKGRIKIPVSLSGKEKTVYMSQDDIAVLFGTTQQNVSLHIKNIIEEGELDENSVHKYYLYTAPDGKKYNVNKYNLDMILAVGYRTRTKDAIEFRHWVSIVLKDYMFDGYAVNTERCIECKDAMLSLANTVSSLRTDVTTLFNNRDKELAYEPGDQLRGFIEVKRYLESAEKEILIIDNYFGHEFDEVLQNLKVKKTVITNPCNTKVDTSSIYKVIKTDYFHDRFVFVDDICYHFGTSPKDLGLHYSIAIRMQDFTKEDALRKLEKYQNGSSRHN